MSNELQRVRQQVADAIGRGDSVYCWTGKLDLVAPVVQAVEVSGWKLEHFSTGMSPSLMRLLATCVFRRDH
jgi:hypothetical protein